MNEAIDRGVLEATLVTDGRSDRMLVPIVEPVFEEHAQQPFVVRHADNLAPGALGSRLLNAVKDYPCNVLLVHRDAEGRPVDEREAEIAAAAAALAAKVPRISVIPVRMTESWLLLDERAIRAASGRPTGTVPLGLPPSSRVESVDAKEVLFEALKLAAELPHRRRFDRYRARQRVAELIEDYESLRLLPSFRHFEAQVKAFFAHDDAAAADHTARFSS